MIEKIKHRGKQIYTCLRPYLYQILYSIMLGANWIYIVLNWEKCISMQLFSRFDGNNILFLVGILLLILPFYEVEGKGFKIRRVGMKKFENDLNKAESEYQKNHIQNIIITQSQGMQSQTEVTENNELSISK